VQTTVEIAKKIGAGELLARVIPDMKDENEVYRRIVLDTVAETVATLGVSDIGSRLENLVIDGVVFVFQ
jgi:splicing factor 3B subunit 1